MDDTFCEVCQETIPYTDKREFCFSCKRNCCSDCSEIVDGKLKCIDCMIAESKL